ncbi:hypothetical protein TrVE_jg7677 [Triparma verrucosa]|uniref:Uncharacterized protein n=1 Tax=Triparma verrucosa TaxID=1606542 RepID=A0A9W7BU04_9STRA|nr:hypothetical protein TrVE_jg7677 [Triparma verrucosa]
MASHYNAPTRQMSMNQDYHHKRQRAPLRPKQTFSPLVAKKMQEARQSSAALASKFTNGLATPPHTNSNDSTRKSKSRRFNLGMLRKANKFNVLVGDIQSKHVAEVQEKIKDQIHVTLDDSTVALFKRLSINHERPADAKPPASKKQIGQPKHILTSEEHAKIASSLAFKYTRDAYKLQSFAALQADRVRLEQLKAEQEVADMKMMHSLLIASHHQEKHEDTIAESSEEDSDSDDKDSQVQQINHQRKRKTSAMLTMKSPLQRSRSVRKSRASGSSFMSLSPHTILDSDSDADSDVELATRVHRKSGSSDDASRRRTTVVANGRVQIKSSPSPSAPRQARGSMSPKAQQRFSIAQATSPVPPTPRSLSQSPTPKFGFSLSRASPQSPTPNKSILQRGGSNRSISIVNIAPVGKQNSSPGAATSRSISFGEAKKEMNKGKGGLSPVLLKRSVSFKTVDNAGDSLPRSTDFSPSGSVPRRMYATRKSFLDDDDSSSEDSFDKEMREDDEKNGIFRPFRQSHKSFRRKDSDSSDSDSDGFDVDSVGSQGSDSSGNSLMLELDIAQARIVRKQEVAEAAREERERTERNKHRKRKADPKECGKERTVAFAHAHLSDLWVETFASNITPLVHRIDFSYNPISKMASVALFGSLLTNLRGLKLVGVNLSHSAEALAAWLGNADSCSVMRLNLSETKLSNMSIATLCDAISQTGTVTDLDLSSNNISTIGCKSIAKMISNMCLQHLSLAWNKIEGSALSPLCKALSKKSTILSLDLSWNSIGTFPTPNPTSIAGMEALCHFLSHTTTLFHFNLSANKFSVADVEKLSKVISDNHTICGFHFDKNPYGHVDSKGYLNVVNDHDEQGKLIHPSQLSHHIYDTAYSGSTCWCCGQWVEVEFEFTQPWVDEDDLEDVYLRLSCDGFRKDKMDYVGNKRWSKFRMVPRITLTYNFCVQKGEFESNVFSPDQSKCFDSTAPTSTVNFISLEEVEIACADVAFEKHYDAALCGGTADNVIWPYFGEVLPMNLTHHHADPRVGGWVEVEKRDNWCLESSHLFGQRKKQNPCQSYWDIDALVAKAFACDWNLLKAKFGRMKIPEDQIKEIGLLISKHYRRFINLYKRNVALARSSTFSLSMISFEHFLTSVEILDGLVKKRDIDRIFISTMAEKTHSQLDTGSPKSPRRTTRALNGLDRWEFFEALVRVAQLKYGYGKADTTSAAFKKLFMDHIRYALYVDPDDFRKEHLYTAECEGVMAVHCHNLHTIFNHYCSTSSSFGRLMNIEEFHQMIEESKLVDKRRISHDQAAVCFVESKFTNVDELKNNRHTTLTFMDFLEVICRMAFVTDHNKGSPHLLDFEKVAQEIQKRHKWRGRIIDDFQKSLVVGLREANTQFKRTLKIVFNDEEIVLSQCAEMLQRFVRGWKARRRTIRMS